MDLFKQCNTCGVFFPSTVKNVHAFCKKCLPAHDEILLAQIKRTRSITPSYYDVFWQDEGGEMHTACRGCGSKLLKKDGKPIAHGCSWRYCSVACNDAIGTPFWGTTAAQFLRSSNVESRMPLPGSMKTWKPLVHETRCHLCGKFVESTRIDVHHVIPVSTLTWDNLNLIWDFSNLQALCKDCHKGDVHALIYSSKRVKKQVGKQKQWRIFDDPSRWSNISPP